MVVWSCGVVPGHQHASQQEAWDCIHEHALQGRATQHHPEPYQPPPAPPPVTAEAVADMLTDLGAQVEVDSAALDALEAAAQADEPAPVIDDPHVARALEYARKVVALEIPACTWVRLACQRQLDDLERWGGGGGPYVWSPAHAGRVCRFIELLRHVKGPLAGQRIRLEPWQLFILTTCFGWRAVATGGRRFRRVYIEVPRGNAKSTMTSGVGLYALAADDEGGAEVYSAATTREQARIVFGDARAMLIRAPTFAAKLGLVVGNHVISQPGTNSKFEPLSREAKSLDGKNLHVALIDELHAHPTREVYDVLETAMAKRLASMLWVITTAGTDTAGICYEVRGYVRRVLEKTVEDDSQFGIIYTIDDEDR